MPKLPVQTNPEVAPQPINLPGPRQTTAGQGLQRLGQAIEQRGQQGMAIAQKLQQEADQDEVQRRLDAQRREMVRWRLDDKESYRAAFTTQDDGSKTKAGVGQTYLDRFDEAADLRAAGLAPTQRDLYASGLRNLRLQWEQEVLAYEAGALKQERIGNAAATIDGVSSDAASAALSITPELVLSPADLQTTLLGMAAAVESPEYQRAMDVIIAEKGLTGKFAEQARQDLIGGHHRLVLESLLSREGVVPKSVVRGYAKSLLESGALTERDPKTRAVLERINKETTVERVETQARGFASQAAADRTGRVGALQRFQTALAGDDSLAAIAPAVERRINDLYDAHEDTLAKDEFVASTELATLADLYDAQRVDDPRLVLADGTRFADLKSAQGRARVARALKEARIARATGRAAPEPIQSAPGRSLWRVVQNMTEAEKATLAQPGSPLLVGIPSAERGEFVKIGQTATTNAGNAAAQARREVAARVEAMARGNKAWMGKGADAFRRASGLAQEYVDRVYAEKGKVTEEDLAAATLYPFEGVSAGFGSDPRFLAPAGEPKESARAKYITPEMRAQAAAFAKGAADRGARAFGGGTTLHFNPRTGEYRYAEPTDPVPAGWKPIDVLGGGAAFDEGL